MELQNFVAIDFETADNGADSACAVGLVRVEDGRIVDELMRLICPPRKVMMFTHIHGLTMNDVSGAPKFAQIWAEIEKFSLGSGAFVAHNAPFDRRVLHACCQTNGIPVPKQDFHCTVQIARKAFNIYPTKLSNVCSALGIDLNHHEALSDARACAHIMIQAQAKFAGTTSSL
ncbi:MAG: 3'-5' exonuclease [Bdellovibrionota bacterium]